ncbi:MAG: hypothetical protein Q7T55_15575 [Solirubrobacteraceae bacterium]|nr:hypothetical protein [Solirubrobacteraceae bacterium]
MIDESARDQFAEIVGGTERPDEGEAARRAQEMSHAAQSVHRTHLALCEVVASAAEELRRRGVPSDTGRFTPTGRGWKLAAIDMWIAWDGSAYITEDAKAGAARQFRFDARREPRNLFELPSWIPTDGGMRHRVVLHGDRLIVSPGAAPFEAVLAAAIDERARRS